MERYTMNTMTHGEAISHYGLAVDADVMLDELIPVLGSPQPQGDVIAVPERILDYSLTPASGVVPTEGTPVVKGENGGNTHLLLPSEGVTFDPAEDREESLLLGILTVAKGASAILHHPQHGYAGIAPGSYELRRQREQADEIRRIKD